MRKSLTFVVVLCLCALATPAAQRRGKPRYARVCGDPTTACRSTVTFEPHSIQFLVPANAVIYETELFYAVILKGVADETRGSDCNVFVPETERIEAQNLFPHNKVFTSRCFDASDLSYTNVAQNQQFMAVYAGRTLAEAKAFLAQVKATRKFPGANLRRMRAGFNGT
jgi:hypothetical protein